MKREYKRPNMNAKRFVASEYIAACFYVFCHGYEGMKGSYHKCNYSGTNTPVATVKNNSFSEKSVTRHSDGSSGKPIQESVSSYGDHWVVKSSPFPATDPHPNTSI